MTQLNSDLNKLMQIYSAKSDAIAKNKGTLKVQESLEQPEIDIENLNEQLGKGNKDVLAELDKYGISYTLAERDNGYTVKFSYNGTNYTIAYHAPQISEPDQESNTENPVTKPGTPEENNSINVTPAAPEATAPEELPVVDTTEETSTEPKFDYSVVDELDTPVKDLYDSETLNDEYKSKIAGSGEKSINSGGYDNVLKELSNMKPQLKSYIKTELEAKGLTYDESIIDKYLNAYISKALSEGILMDGFYDKLASFSNTHNTENKELTIKDVINAIVEKIEEELTDKPEWEDKLLTSSAQEPFGDWYVTTHEYLLDTADYFLNDDEKKLKEAMLAAERDGWLVAQNKDEAADWIDTYAVRMKALIKSRSGSSLSDSQIDSIIKQAKEKTLESAEPITTLDQYDLGDVLKNFKELCETLENEILLK